MHGRVIYWNAAAEATTGYLGAEVLGRTYRGDLLVQCEGWQGCAEVRCPVIDVMRDGKPVISDLFLRHKKGHRVPVRVFAFPLRDAAGEIRGVGELFDPTHGSQDKSGWAGHSDHEFETAAGLPNIAESNRQLASLHGSSAASSSALILIQMSEQHAMMQHGGTAMLHQAIRVLAKTISGMLPQGHYVGCWSDWRLIAIVPDCKDDALERLKSTLSGVGSSCAVKWWGDRVEVGIRAAARNVDSSKTVDELIRGLEQDLMITADRKE
jgi:PAS domain S-box-containing protein